MAKASRRRGRPPKNKPPGYDRPEYVKGYTYDQAKADRVIEFIERFCIHSKGKWAGQPYDLMDWQKRDILEPMFGWMGPDGNRRYKTAAIFTPKKQGKSTMLSALALYFLVADNEPGSEVYTVASDRAQAGIIARECMSLVRSSPFLSSRLEVVESRNTIVDRKTFSRYTVMSSESHRAEGINAHAVLFDELHSQKDRRLFDALKYAGASRANPYFISISTAGYDRSPGAVWWEQWQYCERVAADPKIDPAFFGKVYTVPEQKDPEKYFDKKLWHQANPSLGVTISEESFAADATEARNSASKLNSWLRYRMNVPTQADVRWFTPENWNIGDKQPDEPLAGRECYCGLDLASVRDLSAFVALFPSGNGTFDVSCMFWVPIENVAERELKDRIPYAQWIREGWVRTTPGNVTDYETIHRDIVDFAGQHQIKQVACDRWNATSTMTQLQGQGLDVVGFSQSFSAMSSPCRLLETLVVSGKVRHAGNPVLSWMAGNVALDEDANQNVRPSKRRSTEKIDGIVALVMALGIQSAADIQQDQNWEIIEL